MTDLCIKSGKVRYNWKCLKYESENHTDFVLAGSENIQARM